MQLITTKELGTITPTKTNIEIVAKELSDAVTNGDIDPVEFSIRCDFVIKCLEQAKKNAQQETLSKIDKETTLLGAKVKVVDAGTKYDYTDNIIWQNVEQRLKPILEEKKNIEDKIKMATKIGKSIIDESSGEVIASPVTKTSTTTLKITLAK